MAIGTDRPPGGKKAGNVFCSRRYEDHFPKGAKGTAFSRRNEPNHHLASNHSVL